MEEQNPTKSANQFLILDRAQQGCDTNIFLALSPLGESAHGSTLAQ